MYSVLLKCPFLVNEGLLEGLTTCWAVKQTRAVCNKDRAVCNKEPLSIALRFWTQIVSENHITKSTPPTIIR